MSLEDIWLSASSAAFHPIISKDSQFSIALSLLSIGLVLTTLFGLNRSLLNIPLLGFPASLAFGLGAVLMICAVGVYV